MKFKTYSKASIGDNNNASITPFAQTDPVIEFMEGIDPRYRNAINGYLDTVFNEYPNILSQKLPYLNDKSREVVINELRKSGKIAFDGCMEFMKVNSRKNHVDPIIQAVAILPKDELASMAESLVNLTSFRQRITIASETVGGPVDVAVISKGDGYVWIKRKHYFQQELNHQFIANYFNGTRRIKTCSLSRTRNMKHSKNI